MKKKAVKERKDKVSKSTLYRESQGKDQEWRDMKKTDGVEVKILKVGKTRQTDEERVGGVR